MTHTLLRALRATRRGLHELSPPVFEDEPARPSEDSKTGCRAQPQQGTHGQTLYALSWEPGDTPGPMTTGITSRVLGRAREGSLPASPQPQTQLAGVAREMHSMLGHRPLDTGKDTTLV